MKLIPQIERKFTGQAPTIDRLMIPMSVKASDIDTKRHTFRGLLSVWGPDLGGDVMHRGAFKETIAEWRKSGQALPLLNSHNSWDIFSALGQMLDAKETDEGLDTEWELIEGEDAVRVLERLMPSKTTGRAPVGAMSIGYEPMQWDYQEVEGSRFGRVRNLKKVRLLEGSLVLFPMAPGARIDATTVKSARDMLNVLEAIDPTSVTEQDRSDFRKMATRLGLFLKGTPAAPAPETPPAPTPTPAPAAPPAPEVPEASPTATPETAPAEEAAPVTAPTDEKAAEIDPLTKEALNLRIQALLTRDALNRTGDQL